MRPRQQSKSASPVCREIPKTAAYHSFYDSFFVVIDMFANFRADIGWQESSLAEEAESHKGGGKWVISNNKRNGCGRF